MKAVPCLVGQLEPVLLAGVGLEPERRERGSSVATTASVSARARRRVAAVGDEDVLDPARLAEQLLGRRERHQQRGAVGAARRRSATTSRDAQRRRAVARRARGTRSPGLRAELVGGVGVEVDLARAEVAERDRRAVAARIVPKPRSGAGSLANSVTRGSFWRVAASCTATGSMIAGRDAVDEAGAAQPRARSRSHDALGEVARAGRAPTRRATSASDAAAPRRPRRSGRAPSTATSGSSWLIVSPVASAAAMIAVPSMRPDDDQRACGRAGGGCCAGRACRKTAVAQRERRPRRASAPSASARARRRACRPGCRRARSSTRP